MIRRKQSRGSFASTLPLRHPSPSYVALAGEFFVLGELALQGLDGALTFGHTKEIDIFVLNRQTGMKFKVEVKTTHKGVQQSGLFGLSYAWLMNERHEGLEAADLVYCFVFLGTGLGTRRFFLVPSQDVAAYVSWEHKYWKAHSTRDRQNLRVRVPDPTECRRRGRFRVVGDAGRER
jgi:hypothetical protein